MAAGTQIGNLLLTGDGGYATLYTAGEALYQGEVVYPDATDGKVKKNPVSGATPLGVVFEDANNNASVWIVTSGTAKLLPEAGITAVRGEVAYASAATAGRVAQSASAASQKVGIWTANGTGNGVLTKAVIQCLGITAGGITAFSWSTSEQTWPFEKDASGNTLYAKQVDIGALPNATLKSVAHGISSYSGSKLFRLSGRAYKAADNTTIQMCYAAGNYVELALNATNVLVNTTVDYSGYDGFVQIIYSK